MGRVTRFTETGRPENEIERNFQRKVITFDTIPSLKQLEDGQMGKAYSDGNLNLYIRHKGNIFQVGSAVTNPIVVTPDDSGGGGGSAPPTGGGTISLKYDTDDFQLDSDGYLQIKDSGVDHGGLAGLSDNDHTQYHNAASSPITETGQIVGLNYDADDFEVVAGKLALKISGITDHALLSNLDYANAAHTGFEPTVAKGNLSAGSSKITLGGTGTGAVIGAGASVDVSEGDINHNSLLNTHNLTTDIDHDALTNFVANEHIDHSAVSVLAGAGMSGGGTIDGNVTLDCAITQYTDGLARLAISETITGIDYDNTTGVFSLTTGYVIPTTTQETNWDSAYGLSHNILTITDTYSINLSLTDQLLSADLVIQDTTSVDLAIDASGLKATVLPAGVDHDSLLNYSANKHIDHSGVSILNGNGITGGGDLTASRTLALTTLTSDWDAGAFEITLSGDNKSFILGAGSDMKIYYDGINGNIDTDIIAASDLIIDCGAAKTLALEVPVYNDTNVGSLILVTGGTLPGIVEISNGNGAQGIETRGFAVGEDGDGVFEIPHDYKEGTDIVFHIHWGANSAPSGTDYVNWQIIYSLSRSANVFPNAVTDNEEVAYDTQYEWILTDITTITGATAGVGATPIKIGDQLHFNISRIVAAGAAFAGEALVATMGIHYQCDTLGSRQISIK